jgi:hypothetical protein
MRVCPFVLIIGALSMTACAGQPPAADAAKPGAPANFAPPAASPDVATAVASPAPPAVPVPTAADPGPARDPRPVEEARVREVTIPSGTTLALRMTSGVSSKSSHVEDAVHAVLQRPIVIDGVTVVPSGAAVSGYVTEAERAGRVKGRARIGFRFSSLSGEAGGYDIRTATITRQARATKKADATKIGIGAGAGAIVGALAGGKKGAAIGAAVGGGGGTGVVLATRGEEVAIGSGASVTTRLTAPMTVRVRMP